MSGKFKLKAAVCVQRPVIDPQLWFQSILTLLNCYYVILDESNRTSIQTLMYLSLTGAIE